MELSDFAIGGIFTCGDRRWRCTDIGTRTVTAIALDHEDDRSWYDGPPYAVAEIVFDEDDRKGCQPEWQASDLPERPRADDGSAAREVTEGRAGPQDYEGVDLSILRALPKRRPWQLIMTGTSRRI